ncbi:MAG: adenylyltransferase/cytidyltransferase family protein [Fimbriimonadaceae bacterium]|nr:adenylyltransferase/cytidyltransferase family protein [Fimbriimonadaceae bacterium]
MVLGRAELVARVAARQSRGEVGVLTNGCFDLLHVGHLRTLQAARACGDFLIVGLNSDLGVQRLKGPARPLVPEAERAELLAGLRCVDYVCLFDEPTALELAAALRPRVYVKSVEYRDKPLPERAVVEAAGGRVELVEVHVGHSTTDLVAKVLAGPGR